MNRINVRPTGTIELKTFGFKSNHPYSWSRCPDICYAHHFLGDLA